MQDNPRLRVLRLLIRRLELHSSLSEEDCRHILALPGEICMIRTRADFLHVRETVDHACLVASGIVARYAQLEDGSRQIVSLHIPGDLVDIYSLMLPRAPIPLTALCASQVLRIPHAALRALVEARPEIATILWRDTIVDGSITAQATVNVGRRDARARVAHLLCEMAIRFGRVGLANDRSFPFPVTQEQLGDVTALTSVHVNRMLRALRQDGLAQIANGYVTMLDWEGLCTAAGFDDYYLCPVRMPDPSGAIRRTG